MHQQTEKLLHPETRIDLECVGLREGVEPSLVHTRDVEDIIMDEVYTRLDPEELAEYAYEMDVEYHNRLKAHEGERGFRDNEGVSAYEHEETVRSVAEEWVDANIDTEALAPYTGFNGNLENYIAQQVYNRTMRHVEWDK